METVMKIEKIIAEKGTPEKVYLGDEELFDSVKNIKELEGVPVKVNGPAYRNKNVLLQFPGGIESIIPGRKTVKAKPVKPEKEEGNPPKEEETAEKKKNRK
jgi:hypothetical protein